MDTYVQPTRYCNAEASSIKTIAMQLAEEDETETSTELFTFVRDNIEYNIRRKMKGAEAMLDDRDGMCFDKTNLLIALHRAADIPARYRQITCDLDIKDDDLPAKAFHMVAEAKVDGDWVTLDPSFDESVSEIVTVSEWGEPTWTTIHRERQYAEIPFYLPFVINRIMVPFFPKLKKIQRRIDQLSR